MSRVPARSIPVSAIRFPQLLELAPNSELILFVAKSPFAFCRSLRRAPLQCAAEITKRRCRVALPPHIRRLERWRPSYLRVSRAQRFHSASPLRPLGG